MPAYLTLFEDNAKQGGGAVARDLFRASDLIHLPAIAVPNAVTVTGPCEGRLFAGERIKIDIKRDSGADAANSACIIPVDDSIPLLFPAGVWHLDVKAA